MRYDRPNILLVMCDQMNPLLASAYGDPVAIMPNLDRLADEGVVFEHAYCNSPLCAPSRASMMTGRLIADIACAFDNGSVLNSEIPTFAHMLNREGYRTVLSGKMHFIGADQKHGYRERLTTDIYPADLVWSPERFDADEPTHAFYAQHIYERCGVAEANLQLAYDECVHARALSKLREMATSESPFMMTVSFTHPHSPFQAPARFFDMYRDAAIALPDVPANFPDFLDEYNRFLCRDFGYAGRLDDSLMRTIKQSYYGMYTYLDQKIGELISVLSELDLSEDTVVIFTSDHGEMMGSKGMFEKRTYFEASSRVPLIIWSPGRVKPARFAPPVSLVDLFPTMAELAGARWPIDALPGRSLLPAAAGESSDYRLRTVISEYYGESAKYPYRAGICGRMKYVHFPDHPDRDLLFDLANDTNEASDVSGDSRYAGVCGALRAAVTNGFDYAHLRSTIARSHRDRQLILSSYPMHQPHWDFEPGDGSSGLYVRARFDTDDRAAVAATAPPHDPSA